MLVTSTPSMEGKQIQSYLGIVMGSTVRARHIGTDILATLKNLVGGELKPPGEEDEVPEEVQVN